MRKKVLNISFALVIFFFMILLSRPSMALANDVKLNDLFMNHGSIMLIINVENGKIIDANRAAVLFYGYDKQTLLTMSINEINALSEEEVFEEMHRAKVAERNYFSFRHIIKGGEIKNVEVHSYPYEDDEGNQVLHSIIHDVTDKVKAEEEANLQRRIVSGTILVALLIVVGIMLKLLSTQRALNHISERYVDLFENMHEGFALHEIICDDQNTPIDYRFLAINNAFEKMTGLKKESIINKTVLEVFPETESYWIEKYGDVALKQTVLTYDNYSQALGKHFTVNAYSPKYKQFATIFTDMTDRIEKQNKIEYLSYHDELTGLYNRRFYEEERRRLDIARNLPFSMMMLDVNGLKLSNDAFGHPFGDRLLKCVADVLKEELRGDDIIARVGGDEFVVILPHTSDDGVEHIVSRIIERVNHEQIGVVTVSVSIGWATKKESVQDIEDVLKRAEEMMYRNKLTESKAMKVKTVNTILKILSNRSQQQYNHSENVSKLCGAFGRYLNFGDETVQELERAGALHDIGKISISEEIFHMASTLSDEAYENIKRHTEVGYQILKSVDDYSNISEYVLCHHEWWDGRGYPRGIKGENIPLIARIISIVDAYDAMTSERPYRLVRSNYEAIEELKRCAGSQFDPQLVEVFSKMMLL